MICCLVFINDVFNYNDTLSKYIEWVFNKNKWDRYFAKERSLKTERNKKEYMKRNYLIFAFLIFSLGAIAQVNIELEHNVKQILLEPYTGNLIVEDKENISSINGETLAIDWSISKRDYSPASTVQDVNSALRKLENNDFLGAFSRDEDISLIDNSPFASARLERSDLIINTATGEVVFNSGSMQYRILQTYYLLDENTLLILGVQGDNIDFLSYNLSTKEIAWVNKLGTVDSLGKSLGKLFNIFKSKDKTIITEDKIITTEDSILVTVKGILYDIDKKSGKINWNTTYLISNFYLNQNSDRIIIIVGEPGLLSYKFSLNVLTLSNGEKLWDKDIVTKRISYLEDHKDKLLIAHTSGFNFFSYDNGQKIWKKDAKGKNIKQVIPIDNDYLYIADNEMNLVDSNGQNKWKKFVEIADDDKDEVYYLGKVGDDRVFYLTDTYGNMVDYTTGKKIWKKNVKFDKKRPLVYSVLDDKFVVYNNKRIYTFNNNSKEDPKPKGKIEVKNDKNISSIETFDWGICIIGENDVIGLDLEGNEIYHNIYKEPGAFGRQLQKSGGSIAKVFMRFNQGKNNAMANATVTMNYRDSKGQLHSDTRHLLSEAGQKHANQKSETYGDIADGLDKNLLSKVKNRFKALKQNEDYAFVANRGENGAEIVKVRKKDGEEVVKIQVDSNKPLYEIDPISENLYYATGNVIKVYQKE